MPVANEGFMEIPYSHAIVLVVTVTGWGVDRIYTHETTIVGN